jgi:transcriptional regulator with XRE-family HTH domain
VAILEKLKEYRLAKGMTMKQVAEKIGIAECTYCAYEHGTREPSIEKLKKLAGVFGCSIDDLVGNKEEGN